MLALGNLLSSLDRFLISLLAEPMKLALDLSDMMLGVLQGTAFALLYGLAVLPFGVLSDRFDRRRIIACAVFVWSLATAACGLAGDVVELVAARAMLGVGQAALRPAAIALLAAYLPRHRLGRGVALFTAGGATGRGGALIVGGALLAALGAAGGLTVPWIGQIEPWRGVFVIMAVPGIMLAALMLSVREPPREPHAARPRVAEALRHVLAHRATFVCHAGAGACVILVAQSAAAWVPSFFVRAHGMTPAGAGLEIGSVLLIAGPLGHLAGGALLDWRQAREIPAPAAELLAFGATGAALAITLMCAAPDPRVAVALFGIATFCMMIGVPAALAGLQLLVPDRLRGGVSALYFTTTVLIGIGIGPVLVGGTTDLLGGADQLGRAIAITLPAVALLGATLALAGRRAFAETARIASAHSVA